MQRIAPQPGPQEMFLSTPADIAIYGGAAGGGKTHALLMEPLRHLDVTGFNGVIFRKTYPDITNPGGLWDESLKLYPFAGGRARQQDRKWMFPNNVAIKFSHFQYDSNRFSWQGAQIPFIGWDELTHFSLTLFFYMLSRNRSACGIRPYIRGTCNPDPDHWLRSFLSWWIDDATGLPLQERSGVVRYFIRQGEEIKWYDSPTQIPKKLRYAKVKTADGDRRVIDLCKSFTFIPAKLSDNRALLEVDPAYLANLTALLPHERERLLSGNWDARPAAGDYFKRQWVEVVDAVPIMGKRVRYWDRAATEPSDSNSNPDYTVGTLYSRAGDGYYYVEDVRRDRLRPRGVKQLIRRAAEEDGKEVAVVLEEDPGQAGKADVESIIESLPDYDVRVRRVDKNKGVRFRPFSAQAEAGNVRVKRGAWNSAWFDELEAFTGGNQSAHDDQCDSVSGAHNYVSEKAFEPQAYTLRKRF